jgi:lysophospholipid acyltransferase (LPLAT)-like uncharacterized protein
MLSWRRLGQQRWAQLTAGVLGAEYLRLVAWTSPQILEPPDIYERVEGELPIILAIWHGQHLMLPFIRRPGHRAKVLISRHRDGELNALVAERLGVEAIRGSGDQGGREFNRKGGVAAFAAMLEALEQGYNVATTADVPKVSRVAGHGIVKLAQISGRPIVPIAIATSRRKVLNNWDRTTINLPFSRRAGVAAEPIRVAADADDAALEAARLTVERRLNEATRRAYDIADRVGGDKARG